MFQSNRLGMAKKASNYVFFDTERPASCVKRSVSIIPITSRDKNSQGDEISTDTDIEINNFNTEGFRVGR